MRTLSLVAVVTAAVSLTGCDAVAPADGLVAGAGTTASVTRTPVCHYNADAGTFARIAVADPALDAHLAHGDGVPGGAVPNQSGYTFDEACIPQPDGPPGYACLRTPITNGVRVQAQSPAGTALVSIGNHYISNVTGIANLPGGYSDILLVDPTSPGSAIVTFFFNSNVSLGCPVNIPANP